MTVELSILILLLFLSAFFSGAETSLTTVSKHQIHILVKKKRKGAKSLHALRDKPGIMLATVLIGNNLVNVATTSLATLIFLDLLKNYQIVEPVYITTITTIIVTIFLLVFGEVLPKTIAMSRPKKFSLRLAPWVMIFSIIFAPLVFILNKISNFCIKLLGGHQLEKGTLVTEEEILALIEAGEDSGVIEKEEEAMLQDVIKFGDKLIRDVMMPMDGVLAVEENLNLAKILEVIKERPHSRIPVYRQFRTNIVGILYLKDLLLKLYENNMELPANFVFNKSKGLIRKPYYVYTSQKTTEILKQMRLRKIHLAIVKDREQKVVGIVSIEDLIEEIIGEIEDEFDK